MDFCHFFSSSKDFTFDFSMSHCYTRYRSEEISPRMSCGGTWLLDLFGRVVLLTPGSETQDSSGMIIEIWNEILNAMYRITSVRVHFLRFNRLNSWFETTSDIESCHVYF